MSDERRVVLSLSTNLDHLLRDPITVLVGSSVTLAQPMDIGELLLFVLVLAPVEHLAGTLRMGSLFIAGHVLATCVSEFGGELLHRVGVLSAVAWNRIDVGPSYGEMAVLAGLCFLLPTGRWRRWGTVVAALPVFLTWALCWNLGTTGHVIAFLLGAVLARPVLRTVRARLYQPLRRSAGTVAIIGAVP